MESWARRVPHALPHLPYPLLGRGRYRSGFALFVMFDPALGVRVGVGRSCGSLVEDVHARVVI